MDYSILAVVVVDVGVLVVVMDDGNISYPRSERLKISTQKIIAVNMRRRVELGRRRLANCVIVTRDRVDRKIHIMKRGKIQHLYEFIVNEEQYGYIINSTYSKYLRYSTRS